MTGIVCLLTGMALVLYAVVVAFPMSLWFVAGLVLIGASDSIGRRVPSSRDAGTRDGTPVPAEGEPTMEVRFRRPDER